MHGKAPPIQLLAAFEASARLGSFKNAANELFVTASAVSQQIKQLETYLDIQLFRRLTRRIELTEAGASFQSLSESTLSNYHSNYRAFQQQFAIPTIRLSVIPYVAYEIIIPKLHEFRQLHPDIDLRIETSMSLVDFEKEPIDAAIRFGDEDSCRGLEFELMSDCETALVSSRSLLENRPINGVDDFKQHTLIYTRNNENDWLRVAKQMGVDRIQANNTLVMDSYLASMTAVEQGLGIGIGIFPLSNKWLRMGRLVAVTDKVELPEKMYFVYRRNEKKKAQIECCFQWVKALYDHLHV